MYSRYSKSSRYGFTKFEPFVKFPYVAEGEHNGPPILGCSLLKAIGYQKSYITSTNDDYFINKLLLETVTTGQSVDMMNAQTCIFSLFGIV